jgi:integrase
MSAYLDYVDQTGRYQKEGAPTSQRAMFDLVSRQLGDFAGQIPLSKMSEAVLVSWRDELERNPKLTRRGINRKLQAAQQVFKWGRTRGLVSKHVWADMALLEPLKRGEVGSRPERGRPRRAVSAEEACAVAACCSPQISALLRIQACTGMRPGELLRLRWADIVKNPGHGEPDGWWLYYVDGGGKTAHHDHFARYMLPPGTHEILADYPASPLSWIFSPAAAMADRRAHRPSSRVSKVTPSQAARDRAAKRNYAERWGVNEYRRHVERACKIAGIPRFTPHEVRHGIATWMVENYGIHAAAVALNHRNISTTQAYLHATPHVFRRIAGGMQERSEIILCA